MDNESVANNNENVANNNESVANNNENVANTNKSPATTCCGSGSNKSIVATNKYKYGANNNKSGTTCCCGSVSIETGTYVAAIVLCVLCLLEAIDWFIDLPSPLLIWLGAYNVFKACICLLVIYGQHTCNPWLFVPYMILGVMEIFGRVMFILEGYRCVFHRTAKDYEGFEREYNKERCIFLLAYYAMTFPLFVWFYSIIVRGFSAAREVESRRYRPHF